MIAHDAVVRTAVKHGNVRQHINLDWNTRSGLPAGHENPPSMLFELNDEATATKTSPLLPNPPRKRGASPFLPLVSSIKIAGRLTAVENLADSLANNPLFTCLEIDDGD